jgi:hypothetical protein
MNTPGACAIRRAGLKESKNPDAIALDLYGVAHFCRDRARLF